MPESHMSEPCGCVIRKHGTDKSLVVTSSFLSWKRPKSAMWRVPQSNTYSLTEAGGAGGWCSRETVVCPAPQATAVNTTGARRAVITARDLLCFIGPLFFLIP